MTIKIAGIRQDIQNTAENFIRENQGRKRGLLIKLPCGIGKTRTVSEALFANPNIFTIFLCPRHPNDNGKDNILTWNPEVLHLKGRNQEGMCNYPDRIKIANKFNVNLNENICHQCEGFTEKPQCPYYQQFSELDRNPQPWIGVHHHLNVEFVQRCFKNSNCPLNALVIDEYCIDNIINSKKFDANDLENIMTVVGKEVRNTYNNDGVEAFLTISLTLISTLRGNRKSILRGKEFVELFIQNLDFFKKGEQDIEKIIQNGKLFYMFQRDYKKVLFEKFQKKEYFKDIFYGIFDIAKKCFQYYDNPPSDDFNLPFYVQVKKKESSKQFDKHIIWSSFSDAQIPDVPIIILDATGEKQVYEDAFSCEFKVYDVDIPIERRIYQVNDGFYWSAYFNHQDNKIALFNDIATIIKYHLRNEEHVNIITLKKIELELAVYLERSVGIDSKRYRIHHYGNVKGSNEFMKDNILILLGTPEPNIWDFLMQIGVIYEGKPLITNERIRERKESMYYRHDHRYKDERYYSHVRMKRENEIMQSIDRQRHILLEEKERNKRICYLFSMAKMEYPTMQLSRKDLMEDFSPSARIKGKIQAAKHGSFYVYLSHFQDGVTITELHDKIRNLIPFKCDKPLLHRTHRILIRDKDIEKVQGKLYMTEKGIQLLYQIQSDIRDLELSRENYENSI